MCGPSVVHIAVIGEYQRDHETHTATTAAIGHAARRLGHQTQVAFLAAERGR